MAIEVVLPRLNSYKVFSEKIEGCTGIYVMTQKTPGELINYAAELGIHIWDRDELALQIGRAVLLNMEQKAKTPYSKPETPSTNETLDSPRKPIFEMHAESWKAEEAFKQKPYFSGKFIPLQNQPLRNDETIISSISVTDIVFDVYLGKWNYRAIPKVKTWSYFLTIP